MSYEFEKQPRDLYSDKLLLGEKGLSPAVDAAYKRNIVRTDGRAAETQPLIQEDSQDRLAMRKMTSGSLNMREKFAIGGQYHAHKDSFASNLPTIRHSSDEMKGVSVDLGSEKSML